MRSRALSGLPENPTVGSESSLSVVSGFPKSQVPCLVLPIAEMPASHILHAERERKSRAR